MSWFEILLLIGVWVSGFSIFVSIAFVDDHLTECHLTECSHKLDKISDETRLIRIAIEDWVKWSKLNP